MRTILPLYALPRIYPYRSYIGTLANRGFEITLTAGGPAQSVRFPTGTKATCTGAGGAGTLCSSFFLDSA